MQGRSRHGLSVRDRVPSSWRRERRTRRPPTTICVNVSAKDLARDQCVDPDPDPFRLDVAVLLLDHVLDLVPGLLASLSAGHHAFDCGAVLSAVNALRCASTPRSAGPSGVDRACAQRAELAFA
jgi:hypothetical protein